MESLLQGDHDVGFHILTALGNPPKSSPAAAEHLLEEIAEARSAKRKILLRTLRSGSGTESSPARNTSSGLWAVLPIRSVIIVALAFFGVAEDFVGFVDLFEFLLRLFFVFGGIRVVLAGQFAECGLDLGGAGRFGNTEGLVVIAELCGHVGRKSLAHFAEILHPVQPMLDIRLIREQPDLVKSRLATRSPAHVETIDAILAIDIDRRASETRLQTLQGDRNRLSKEIGKLRAQKLDSADLEAQVKKIAEEMERASAEAESLSAKQREILLNLPNMPQADVPVGRDAADNPVVRIHGEKPVIAHPKDHVVLAESLGLIDPDRATKISGSGFAVYTGQGARLERALLNFLLDTHTREHGYTEVSTPFVVRRECMVGTGQLPKFEEDMYGVDGGGLFLVPTAEVPVTNLHREEIVSAANFPIQYAAYTPCFRREAGSAGRETRGLIRMHQFDKVELVKICAPEQSNSELESLTANAERILQKLGLHYRVIVLCTGDMGFGSAKTYDIEVWAPGQNSYLEVSSCSNFEDYQARRMNLRFKGEDGKNRYCHTLNGSGTALARLYVALLENYQQPDGTVRIPEALQTYFGADKISK